MDNKLYKRILLSLLSLFLIIGCVTYQPKPADAILGKVASYGAKKAAVWVAKNTVEESIEKILKKKVDLTDPLFDKYIKRIDYDLVHIDGKTFLMKNNLSATERNALSGQIETVIDRMIYGKNAAWLSWVDWWSIGPMILVGNILFSEMTDENYSFINDVLMQALIDLGFLTTPEDNFIDDKTQKPVVPEPTPEPTAEPDKNKNFGGTFSSAVNNGSNYKNMPIQFAYAPYVPRITFVAEVVPKASVTNLGTSPTLGSFSFFAGKREYNAPQTNYEPLTLTFNGSIVTLGSSLIKNFATAKKSVYRDGSKLYEGTSNDLSAYINPTHISKMNRYVYSIDVSSMPYKYSLSLRSTVSNVPTYSIMVTSETKDNAADLSEYLTRVTFPVVASTELNNAGFDVYWSLFTDRVISLPTPKPAPQLKDVKPSTPKDYVSSPVINKDPKTGKPTMAVPTTVIVQDPTKNPVKPDPKGGIIISKPDGTPVTEPDTELDPVTNQPEVKPNPDTGEPEIIVQPNKPPEPATPPKTDPPNTEDPDTGDPDTGDPRTETPPTDPDDEDPSKVKWDKLKTIPSFMTTRFPFSLPWDIGRFLDAVFPDVTPISELSYEFPDIGGYDTSFEITVPEFFDPWMDFARAAFVYGFDISLVYAIYRLFGGAQ